jgi:hypothetical protein
LCPDHLATLSPSYLPPPLCRVAKAAVAKASGDAHVLTCLHSCYFFLMRMMRIPHVLHFLALVYLAALAKAAQGAVAEVRALAGTKEGLSKACVAAE